jgi:hypothetical protein
VLPTAACTPHARARYSGCGLLLRDGYGWCVQREEFEVRLRDRDESRTKKAAESKLSKKEREEEERRK